MKTETSSIVRHAISIVSKFAEFRAMPIADVRQIVEGAAFLFPELIAAQLARNCVRFERTGSFTKNETASNWSRHNHQGAVDDNGADLTFGNLVCKKHANHDPATIAEMRDMAEKIANSLGDEFALCIAEGYSYSEAVELGAITCKADGARRIADTRAKFANV